MIGREDLVDLIWMEVDPGKVDRGSWSRNDCEALADSIIQKRAVTPVRVETIEELLAAEIIGTILVDSCGDILMCYKTGGVTGSDADHWMEMGLESTYTYRYVALPATVLQYGSGKPIWASMIK